MEELNDIYIGGDELIFNKTEDGKLLGGGFSVSSIMKKAGISPIQNINLQVGGSGEKVSDLFQHLAVPNWTTMYNMHGGEYKKNKNDDMSDDEDNSDIEDELHDKLLALVKDYDNKRKKQNKKTKKRGKEDKKNISKKNKLSKKE